VSDERNGDISSAEAAPSSLGHYSRYLTGRRSKIKRRYGRILSSSSGKGHPKVAPGLCWWSVFVRQKKGNSYLELPSGAEVQPVCAARLYAYRSLGGFGAGISRLFSMC